eukprot:COSAG05_NODE_1094_length_5906_cov_299.271569_2_plen_40_part_00
MIPIQSSTRSIEEKRPIACIAARGVSSHAAAMHGVQLLS